MAIKGGNASFGGPVNVCVCAALTQQLTLGHYFHLRHVNLLPHQLLLPICEANAQTNDALAFKGAPIH